VQAFERDRAEGGKFPSHMAETLEQISGRKVDPYYVTQLFEEMSLPDQEAAERHRLKVADDLIREAGFEPSSAAPPQRKPLKDR
jgi:hypothetical protein